MSGGLEVTVTNADLRQMYLDLKAVEGNLQVDLRRAINACTAPIVQGIQQEAGWSTRIPGAVHGKVSFGAKSAGVAVTVNARIAPEAAPLENKGKPGLFRHPVFGNRDTWVNQSARPFFYAGAARAQKTIDAQMRQILDDVAAKAGFR